MLVRRLSEEVLVAEGSPFGLEPADVDELKRLAAATARRRIRVCAHPGPDDPLHEMLIVHAADAYVRPHKHVGKSESLHVVEGEADAVFFDDEGNLVEAVPLGTAPGRTFYYRIQAPLFHTLLVASDFFVFHEVTNGPFRREETVFAPWSPEEDDVLAADDFRRRVRELAGRDR
jgi:cupin fold WbuC family metalloprotein